jgi:hypothetical protein
MKSDFSGNATLLLLMCFALGVLHPPTALHEWMKGKEIAGACQRKRKACANAYGHVDGQAVDRGVFDPHGTFATPVSTDSGVAR